MNYPELVPFDSDGMVSLVKPWKTVELRNNPAFEDKLLITLYIPEKPKCRAFFVLRSIINGQSYPIFPEELLKALQRSSIVERGALGGVWRAIKEGDQFSLSFLVEKKS